MITTALTECREPTTLSGDTRRWFAVYTSSCHEKRVAQHCQVREIESFLPTYRDTRRWKNGCIMKIERPLFPGYVFVRFSPAHRVRILELPGVVSLVGAARQPAPLPDTDIEALRSGLPLLNAEPFPYLNVGDRVKVRNGPLAGITGLLVRKKNSIRVILTLELILKSISVEIDEQDLELAAPRQESTSWNSDFDSREVFQYRRKRELFDGSANQ
jgi:transcription antitermination factor NusG